MRRFTGHHIFSFFFRAIERNTTDRRFGIGFYLLTMIAFGYSIASQSLMGEANGAKKASEVGNIFRQSAVFLLIFSLLILLALPFSMRPLFSLLVYSYEVREQAQDYFFWRTIGIVFAMGAILFRGFFF